MSKENFNDEFGSYIHLIVQNSGDMAFFFKYKRFGGGSEYGSIFMTKTQGKRMIKVLEEWISNESKKNRGVKK